MGEGRGRAISAIFRQIGGVVGGGGEGRRDIGRFCRKIGSGKRWGRGEQGRFRAKNGNLGRYLHVFGPSGAFWGPICSSGGRRGPIFGE